MSLTLSFPHQLIWKNKIVENFIVLHDRLIVKKFTLFYEKWGPPALDIFSPTIYIYIYILLNTTRQNQKCMLTNSLKKPVKV